MEIYLDGIGLIKKSTIKLEGLTVITGENNSGKSTVGKALYAIADGMVDIDAKQERDELEYCRDIIVNQVRNSVFMLLQVMYPPTSKLNLKNDIKEDLTPLLDILLKKPKNIKFSNKQYLIGYLKELLSAVNTLKPNITKKMSFKEKAELNNQLTIIKQAIFNWCNGLKTLITTNSQLHDFRLAYLSYALANEFDGEIQPVKTPEITSKIRFTNQYNTIFQCSIEKNGILAKDFTTMIYDLSKVFFIDNAFILDELNKSNTQDKEKNSVEEGEDGVNKALVVTHKEKLIEYLNTQVTPNITHELKNAKKYSAIKEKILSILPGDFKSSNDGLKYVHEGTSLKAVNLATGSKMFAIIKMILDRYGFDDRTMLILDEPEAHLHPKWQNMFAEVIVLLVKELGVRVLLTSHSTHFVLALDAHMRKHEIIEKTNFYQTEIVEDGFVQYQLVNDDLGAIYDDFAAYFAESKYMRDKYLYGDDE